MITCNLCGRKAYETREAFFCLQCGPLDTIYDVIIDEDEDEETTDEKERIQWLRFGFACECEV